MQATKDAREVQNTIDRLNQGKFTFGGMFQNDNEKKQSAISKRLLKEQLDRDIVNYDTIKKFLIIYLWTVAIPNFKKSRTENYVRAMSLMTNTEVRNSNAI